MDANTKYKVYLNGKLYATAAKSTRLGSLSYYLHLSVLFPHKTFTKDRVSEFMNVNTFNKHARILKEMGLLTYSKGWYILSSRKQVEEKYGKARLLYMYVSSLNDIKKFLQVVPVISNIYRQNRVIAMKDDFRRTNVAAKEGKYVSVSKKTQRAYLKAVKSGMSFEFDNLKLSLNKIMELANCSKQKAVQVRKWIKELGIASFKRVRDKVAVPSRRAMSELQKVGIIKSYASYHNGYAYFDLASNISLKSNFYSFSSFSYNNTMHLKD